MKHSLFILFLFNLTLSCGQNSPQKESTPKENNNTSTKSTLPEKKEACDFLTMEEIGAFFNWEPSIITQQLMMKLERYNQTFCNHFTPNGEKFILRINWKSKKAQQRKVFEKQYNNYLLNGEDNLKYKKSNTSMGTESLFGFAPDRDHKTRYILRTRFQNEVEIIIEAALDKNDPVHLEKTLREILAKIL